MRIAVSNIAWTAEEDAEVETALADAGVDAIEIAPTRTFADPDAVTLEHARRRAERYAGTGLEVVAFQSILFGHPELTVFGDEDVRRRTAEHLERQMALASAMGARRLVFGSPRNRRLPAGRTAGEVEEVAVEFFRGVGAVAVREGVVLCIEPNPPAYGCDFITTAEEGGAFVRSVDSPGFGLHLDSAGMVLSGEPAAVGIDRTAGLAQHFHASAPELGELEEGAVDHAGASAALRRTGYRGIVSIEMRAAEVGANRGRVLSALALARRHYAA